MDTIDAPEIAALLTRLSLCGHCIAYKTGVPRGQVDDALERLTQFVKVGRTVSACDACLKLSVVHRLG